MTSGQPKKRLPLNPGVPAIYLLLLCDVVRGLGHDDGTLLQGLDVTRAGLLQPDARVPVAICHTACRRAVALAGHQGLGLIYARALKVTLHGPLGMMALSSPSVGAAIDAAARYITLRAPFLTVRHETEGDTAVITFEPRWDLGDLEVFLLEVMLVSLAHMAEQLLGEPVAGAQICFRSAPPPYLAAQADSVPALLCYEQPASQLRAPLAAFDAAPRLADPAVAALAREQCEQEFRQLAEGADSVVEQVAQQLRTIPEGVPLPALEQMAATLHLSSRTFKRRLQQEQANYRDLLEAELQQRAVRLLSEGRLGITEVAYQLGYSDVSNFSRAFRRWTGKAPRQWRSERS
ncbi:AraC family transcriptional regulator [Alcanivorax quisquiliarum]|uniref:AraC family transcriptional regulator n=1 Tax=Alcanivorax quisquiliarum TaxID=2933565 RepID=A0ABT0E367_9GAMM|nr:AraC family transcriptional regulator [Alcanivorax quisquiliarum]